MNKVEKVFSQSGQLAKAIDGYQPRQAQIELASGFWQAMNNKQLLVAEAGTGTGKTFAYLVPALLSDKKVIVSTGTKALQEQLFHRDLPLIKKALGSYRKVALLKGRANYLCPYRLTLNKQVSDVTDKQILADMKKVSTWANKTQTGDIGELSSIGEDSRVFPLITSTIDNCLGKECPNFEDCYLVKARKKAIAADLVVVNHHLYFADLAVKDTGFGEIVPDSDVVVFDEAHQLPDIACEYFGERFSTRQMADLAKDIELEYRTELKDVKQLGKVSEKLTHVAREFRLAFPHDPVKGNWREKIQDESINEILNKIYETIDFAYEVVKQCVSRTKGIDSCFERLCHAQAALSSVTDMTKVDVSLWYETTMRHVSLNLTPLSVADKFAPIMQEKQQSWLMTSATLSVDGGFSHFTELLGLNPHKTLVLDSPFAYDKQALLCVPRMFPEPNDRDVLNALVDVCQQLIKASGGRCFLLFTSYRMMNLVANRLEKIVKNPLLVQGQTGKRELLNQFLADDETVLLATGAFWEGVDVRGDALKCVLIDKLPFASPDDPVTQARIDNCKRQGLDPFSKIQIPQAVITLKQGAGRLIRDVNDTGVLVICDPRIATRQYGQSFIKSLPNMQRTRSMSKVVRFLSEMS
ncbi:ATP-dependent helicase [Saccharobesus litoralis]|uniref:ATP-dependent DNA helicase YoaA n=1 Tax=Saccharobesus litoralis TaxID=2172099 RepID=A0A2S0VUH3_9ALTE|nr:ATP-dependent DNA helicase [Saccharobesus litoralis]AWB67858.1 ATP-dependent helicase [Saccharobesus litoralis]